MVKRMRLEHMEEQAKLVSAASLLIEKLSNEERRKFMEQFNAPGWDSKTMRDAVMYARQRIAEVGEFVSRAKMGLPG